MPLLTSLKGESTFPLAGHIQSTSSPSVPADFSGSAAGGRGGGATSTGAGAGPVTAAPPASAAPICASALSEKGTLVARGSTLAFGVLASGRASMGGPACASGVVTGALGGAMPAGTPSISTWPISMRLGLVMLFHAASSR